MVLLLLNLFSSGLSHCPGGGVLVGQAPPCPPKMPKGLDNESLSEYQITNVTLVITNVALVITNIALVITNDGIGNNQ